MELCSSILSSSEGADGIPPSCTLSFEAVEWATETGSWARGAGFRTIADLDETGPAIELSVAARVCDGRLRAGEGDDAAWLRRRSRALSEEGV
jgi:hypothetical protein